MPTPYKRLRRTIWRCGSSATSSTGISRRLLAATVIGLLRTEAGICRLLAQPEQCPQQVQVHGKAAELQATIARHQLWDIAGRPVETQVALRHAEQAESSLQLDEQNSAPAVFAGMVCRGHDP